MGTISCEPVPLGGGTRYPALRALVGWGGLILVLLAGLAAFLWKLKIVGPSRYLGLADPAAYGNIAHSILTGRGLEVDYISLHFRKFGPEITHPEEIWPPFYPLLIVPFFAIMGKCALAAKLPSLLISCFGLPSMTYVLARRVTRSGAVALAAALSILLYEPIFTWSLEAMADITFGFLILAAVWFALKGFENSRWFIPMGIALALSYYTKGLGLVFIPAFLLYWLLRRVLHRPWVPWNRKDLSMLKAVLVLLVMLAPWFVRNAVHFGDPLYASHQHVAGYVGWEPWMEKTLALYWDREPPSAMAKLIQPDRLLEKGVDFFLYELRLLFLQKDVRLFSLTNTPLDPFSFRHISTYWTGLPALLGIVLFLAGGLCVMVLRILGKGCGKEGRGSRIAEGLGPFVRPEYGLFVLLGFALVSVLSLIWIPNSRYNMPFIPLVMILGFATVHAAVRCVAGRRPALKWLGGAVVLVLFAVWAVNEREDLLEARASGKHPWAEGGRGWIEVGEWIHENAPGSVTMTRYPWALNFYAGEKAVQLPFAPMHKVIEVARYYKVTHFIPVRQQAQPDWAPVVPGTIPWLRLVHSSWNVELYEIVYDLIPPGLMKTKEER